MLGDFGFGEVQVHLHALVEQFGCLGGVAEEQLAHDAVRGHLVEVAVGAGGDETFHAVFLYGRGKYPPRFSPGPALIIVPFGNTIKTRPSRVLRYPYCGAQAPPRNAQLTATCPALSEIRLVLA